MGTILAVSSSYLDPLFENAKKYSFKLQAYSDFSSAIKGLSYVNKVELIGIAIVDDFITDKKGLQEFLHACDMVGELNVIFATMQGDKSHLEVNTSNLHVEYIPNISVFTDIVINREIFGTLLLHKYKPYKLKKETVIQEPGKIPRLSYAPIISQNVLNVLKPVNLERNYEELLTTDTVLLQYKQGNPVLFELRLLCLKNWYGKACNADFENVYNQLATIQDCNLYCQYVSILEIIRGSN